MIEIQSVRIDDYSMDYFKFGRGEKSLVILPGISVQSVMNSAEAIADTFLLMQENFTIYVFDRKMKN